jgi:ABC-type dipeptide/oligopeptide/nickel transport system ATPase component
MPKNKKIYPSPLPHAADHTAKGDSQSGESPLLDVTFTPRCQYVQASCKSTRPELKEFKSAHYSACHLSEW